jgi:microcystin-dependent protein
MGVIKPNFPDATYIKTNDLTRLLEYTATLTQAIGKMFSNGILSGLTPTAILANPLTFGAGAAVSDDGSILTFDSGEISVDATQFWALGATGVPDNDVWVYLTNASTVVDLRTNLVGQAQPVSYKSTYAVSYGAAGIPGTASVKFRLCSVTSTAPALTSVVFNYALNSLTHVNTADSANRYNGSLLHGTNAIQAHTITESRIVPSTLSSVSVNPAEDFVPAGAILPFGGTTIPTGWLMCDGSYVSNNTYSELYTAIGNVWGPSGGTSLNPTFKLPGLQGMFLRGAGGTSGIVLGAFQDDAFQDHTHQLTTYQDGQTQQPLQEGSNRSAADNTWTTKTTSSPSGKTSFETRPKNYGVNYIICTGKR